MKFDYDEESMTFRAVDAEGVVTCELADDEDTAMREFALREHLKDWTSKMVVHDDHGIEVNPCRAPSGVGPDEARTRVAWVKECLNQVKHVSPLKPTGIEALPRLGEASLSQLESLGYRTLTAALQLYCPEEAAKGFGTLLNTVYFLVTDQVDPGQVNLRKSLREAWVGDEVVDRRTWYDTNDGEYLVLTDDEADRAWDDELECYIDDCLEIPDGMKPYFDRAKWKRDARMDGRGSALSSYDGAEHWVDVENTTFFIYRTN